MEDASTKARIESTTDEVFALYRKHGDVDYIGEPVTQSEHAVQCAMLANKDGYPEEVILGALFHDIGHVLGIDRGMQRMITGDVQLGTADHDIVGEDYLKNLGFPSSVTDIVRGHVSAKRYLVATDKKYNDNLTVASKMTLVHQGGPMTREEADEFEKNPNFEAILKMRHWDESAKDPYVKMNQILDYVELCKRVLKNNLK
ncbi:HD phosphohydrolase-like [Saccoglossus kowalevskii]|uniref:HD phosphohydrolase-like n=1 Tax=Saccoglossus kowalevskii TaxID=10224 RepID=A0ABM0GGW5_SACKO|nr:HD phosphohydrolase-like [Saccoglossus kowalevskii]